MRIAPFWSPQFQLSERLSAVLLLSYLVLSSYPARALPKMTGKEVMERHEKARLFEDIFANASLRTVSSEGRTRVKEFRFWRKKSETSSRYQTLTRFDKPAEVAKEGVLILEREDGQNDVLLYLPNFKKIRRVETQSQNGSFMGSDLSYTDLSTQRVDDFDYESKPEEKKCGNSDCYLVKLTPAREEVKVRVGASFIECLVSGETFMVLENSYFDDSRKLIKKILSQAFVSLSNRTFFPSDLRVENKVTGSVTELKFTSVRGNSGVKSQIFTQQNLANP